MCVIFIKIFANKSWTDKEGVFLIH